MIMIMSVFVSLGCSGINEIMICFITIKFVVTVLLVSLVGRSVEILDCSFVNISAARWLTNTSHTFLFGLGQELQRKTDLSISLKLLINYTFISFSLPNTPGKEYWQ